MAELTWANLFKITIPSSLISTDITNNPVPIMLGASSGISGYDTTDIFDKLGANKWKVAFTAADKETMLYAEIEYWDATSEIAVFWVNIPTLSSSANTIIYIWYDPAQADNTTYLDEATSAPASYTTTNHWSTRWKLVTHFDNPDDSYGDTAEYKQSAAPTQYFTQETSNSTTPPVIDTDETPPWGRSSCIFNGADNRYLRLNQAATNNFGTGDFAFYTIVKFNAWHGTNTNALFLHGNAHVISTRHAVAWYNSSTNTIRFGVYNPTALNYIDAAVTLSLNTWYDIVLTRYGGYLRVFVNGVEYGTPVSSSDSGGGGVTQPIIPFSIYPHPAWTYCLNGWSKEIRWEVGNGISPSEAAYMTLFKTEDHFTIGPDAVVYNIASKNGVLTNTMSKIHGVDIATIAKINGVNLI